MRSEYVINKGVNSEIEFKGLRGQWIYYLGGGLASLLILFVVMYLCGVPTIICLSVVVICATYLFRWVYNNNATFGSDGLMKKRARKMLPRVIKNNTRKIFISNR